MKDVSQDISVYHLSHHSIRQTNLERSCEIRQYRIRDFSDGLSKHDIRVLKLRGESKDLGTAWMVVSLVLKNCETCHIFFRPWLAVLKHYELTVYWTAFTRKVFAGFAKTLHSPEFSPPHSNWSSRISIYRRPWAWRLSNLLISITKSI